MEKIIETMLNTSIQQSEQIRSLAKTVNGLMTMINVLNERIDLVNQRVAILEKIEEKTFPFRN